jgi:hypothetical protein
MRRVVPAGAVVGEVAGDDAGGRDRRAVEGDLEAAQRAGGVAAVVVGEAASRARREIGAGTFSGVAKVVMVSSASGRVKSWRGAPSGSKTKRRSSTRVAGTSEWRWAAGARGGCRHWGSCGGRRGRAVPGARVIARMSAVRARGFERAAERFQRQRVVQVGGERVAGAGHVDMLHAGGGLEVFDRAGGPAGDVAGELFQDRGGALAPAAGDGVGGVGARREGERVDLVERR